MAKRTAQATDHLLRLPEPPILEDTALRDGLTRKRQLSGGYFGISPTPEHPELRAEDAALLAALLRWRDAAADPAYAAAVARGLVGCFPAARVDAESYAAGLAAIAEDDRISADIVRAVCRRVRAEQRSLPPLADLRKEMLAEVNDRAALLSALAGYRAGWKAERQKEMAEADRVAGAAAAAGVQLDAAAVVDGWYGLSACCWLHERCAAPARETLYFEDNVIAAVMRGGPHAAEAARLLALVAPHERAREAALAKARETFNGLPNDAPEWREWDAAWPIARNRFAAQCDALADALCLAHSGDGP